MPRSASTGPLAGPLALAAAAAVLGAAGLLAAPAASAQPAAAARGVDYRGHHFTVPADWALVDLDAAPGTCVDFSRHALYYGTPAAAQDCPAGGTGRTEALLVEPATSADAPGTRVDAASQEIDAADAQVHVLAGYRHDPALVRQIVAGAGLPGTAPAARPSTQRPAVATPAALPANTTSYTGKGFDACEAPTAAQMSAWKSASPYGAVGIYFGGPSRACADQPNLSASWLQQQSSAGWRFLPIYGGVMADDITSPTAQGTASAQDAASRAASYGLPQGSVLYDDMEAYSPSYSGAVLAYLSAWTKELHTLGYQSGVYSSSSSGIEDLADHYGSGYEMPDVIYDALWNGSATTSDPAVPAGLWADHQRVHQYSGGHNETYGGATLNIDSDYLDVAARTASAAHGTVWDRTRSATGGWQAHASEIDDNDAITAVASAGLPDGTLHTFTVVPGSGVWERVRSASGTWAATATHLDDNGSITALSAAALPDGTLHLDVVVKGSGVWDRTRSASGTWAAAATQIDDNAAITRLASAGLPDGTVHLEALVPGSGIWERVRSASGSWAAAATHLDTNGSITALSTAALPDGTQHLDAVVPGSGIWDRTRTAAGTWQSSTLIDTNGSISAVGTAALPDGTLHVDAVVPGSGVWDRTRGTAGGWAAAATQIDDNGAIFTVQPAALPDGTLHVHTIV
jgi:hypothetical protein